MDVTKEKSSLNTNSGTESKFIEMEVPLSQVDVKIERESEEGQIEIELLYEDHVIKEEMVIGPTVLQKEVHINTNDTLLPTNLDEKTNQEDPQKETTKEIDNKRKITSNVDLNINTRAYNQTKLKFKPRYKTTRKVKPRYKTTRRVFDNNENLDAVTSYNVFTCNDCGQHFKRKHELMKHIKSHEKMKQKIYLKCEECIYQTVILDALERHKKVHDKKRRFVCNVCGCRFKKTSTLWSHLRSHVHEKTYSCNVCDYKSTRKSHLTKHLTIHTGVKPYSCNVCNYKSTRKMNLNRHLQIHTGEKPYFCTICEYKCNEKGSLTRHLMNHTGEKPYSCTICDYKCIQKHSLNRHMKIHTGQKETTKEIETEGKITSNVDLNKPHYNTTRKVLNKDGNIDSVASYNFFTCNDCGERFKRKHELVKHIKFQEKMKQKIYLKCKECIYQTVIQESLERHKSVHDKKRRFMCDVCGYRFKEIPTLRIHLKKHLDEKTYSSTVCDYKSTGKFILIHT